MHTITKQARALHNALTDITTIDRHITTIAEDRARHRRCNNCRRWRKDGEALDLLLTLRLRFMDRRDAAQLEGHHL